MKHKMEKEIWEEYKSKELARALPLIKKFGFEISKEQPHTEGERYLMRAVTTTHGRKLILLGTRIEDAKKVVIKVTSDLAGKQEIKHERESRRVLHKINFAYDIFFSPEEILFGEAGDFLISIQAFIEQKCPFTERPTKEQFALALKAFKAQESAHATTYGHVRLIKSTFGSMNSDEYIDTFKGFRKHTALLDAENINKLLQKSEELLTTKKEVIEQYTGFLTHIDFVPHNFRIVNGNIYLLDHSSIRFGNKYEGWARFVNFMELYNPELAEALVTYVKNNRTKEESEALKLMRVYRLGEIILYYTHTLEKSSGNLHILNEKRIHLWTHVLDSVLEDKRVSKTVIETYKKDRDLLRSEEEKKRQQDLH